MSSNARKYRKQILSDPVTVFSVQHPDADKGKFMELSALWQQLQLLKKQRKETQTQSKSISRRIGEAKYKGNPVDELKASMQEQSIRLQAITDELDGTEIQILSYFKPISEDASTNPELNDGNEARIYAASTVNLDDISISLLNDERNEWNTYASKHPAATIHHRAEWREILKKSYGHESFYFLARDTSESIVGILPLIRLKSRLFGDFFISMPYFQRGGAIGDHPTIEQKLIQTANAQAANLGVAHIEYRDDISRPELPAQTEKVNMLLSLPETTDILWNSFTSKLRTQIRRPQRERPQVLIGDKVYLDDFYTVYTRNMRDLGSPAHSKLFVENILDCFQENSWIIVLRLDEQPVATGLLLGSGNTLEIPLASTIREFNPLSMNMLMYWEVLKFAIHHGYRFFDFGRSSKGAGTYRFKQQWGAQPKQLYWHYWLSKEGEIPLMNPSNPKYALMISAWKRLPVTLTKWLGPLIVKNIP